MSNIFLAVLVIVSLFASLSNSCECGRQRVISRVFGGSMAQPNQFPWQVGLICGTEKQFHICGGALINDRYVLTAAHCVTNMTSNEIRIVIGQTSLQKQFQSAIYPEDIIIYRGYVEPPDQNDIALLKLPNSVTFNDSVAAICLPEPTMQRFSNLYAAGFGQTKDKSFSSELLYIDQLVQKDGYCTEKYGKSIFTPSHICATTTGRGLCEGDSGGALVTNYRGVAFVVGITSFGKDDECGNSEWPVVFTRVSSFLPWIRKHTKDANWCSNGVSTFLSRF